MTSILTRIQYKDLYERMQQSALRTCLGEVEFLSERDTDGQPHVSHTYNRLLDQANGDIIVFCHDDIVFLEDGWDARLAEFFATYPYDIGGVVGVDKYEGGRLVAAGHPHCFGKFVNRSGDELRVNLYGPKAEGKKLKAVDGMFIATRGKHRERFDEELDGLFFYDLDYCLRGSVGLIDILLGHWKPADRFGKYPKDMKPEDSYTPYFYAKHGLKEVEPGDTRALCASQEDYANVGHDKLWSMFRNKYLVGAQAG